MSLQNCISNDQRISYVDLKKEFSQSPDSAKNEVSFLDLTGDLHNNGLLCLNRKFGKGVFKCEYCNFMCSKLGDLQSHITFHLQVIQKDIKNYGVEHLPERGQKIHVCEECGVVFVFSKTKTNFQIEIYKGDSDDSCDECSNNLIKVGDVSESDNLEHHDVDKILPSNAEEDATLNVSADSGYFENINVKQEKQIIVKQENQSSSEKNHDIPVKKTIIIKKEQDESSITNKYKHKSAAKFRPYACTNCPFRAVEENTLKKHFRTHFIEKKFACPHCSYKGEKAILLKNHLRTHSDEKPHVCSHCQYQTNNLPNLKRHERRHTGEKPFPCTECDYKGVQKIALQNHMKSKHNL